MKKKVEVYLRRTYNSGPGGTFGAVAMPEQLLPLLGSATSALVEITVYAVSGANAQFRVQVWQGTKTDIRPSFINGGLQIGTDTVPAAVGVSNITVAAPFHNLLEIVAGADSSDANITWVEAGVNVTLSFD